MSNIIVKNITCLGESGDTSFILFDSGEDKKQISINNIDAENVLSNGSFIKIDGDSNELTLKNSNINYITSYGSIINNKSKKVYFYFYINSLKINNLY